MTRAASRRPSVKARRKLKRPQLSVPAGTASPVLIGANASGVEACVRERAAAFGLGVIGYYCPASIVGERGLVATTSGHPSQALKWNTRAADATLLLLPDGPVYGRARAAQAWCRRYRKRWLLLTPASFDADALQRWLRTQPPERLQITGPLAHQADLSALVDRVLKSLNPVLRPGP